MEKALFPHAVEPPFPAGFSRLYFGSEFCAWAFPPTEVILRAISSAHESGWAFTLALPVMTESLLASLPSLLDRVAPLLTPGDEVLVSDLGQITPVSERLPTTSLILGRALSGQKRGPQILELSLTAEQLAYFRQGSWYSADAGEFLREKGISRMELDNLLQGVDPLPPNFTGSLHYPFSMVTSSRNCPNRSPKTGRCGRACQEPFVLRSPRSPLPLLQAGNTQFLRHDDLPPDLSALGIDRLVLHPELPR